MTDGIENTTLNLLVVDNEVNIRKTVAVYLETDGYRVRVWRVVLGLTRHGIVDVTTEQPVEVVLLTLFPAQSPTAQLRMLALTSKAGQKPSFPSHPQACDYAC